MLLTRLLPDLKWKLLLTVAIGLIGWSMPALSSTKPLLMEGKQSLYQRVLSVPDARLYQAADEKSANGEILPFSVLYVYQREGDWMQVGHDSFGKLAGWMKTGDAITWNQALTVSFKDPQDIQRVMLFDERENLFELVDGHDRESYQSLYDAIVAGEPPADSPVIAMQPEAHVEIHENFYLVPIQQHEDVFLGSEQARLLQIASVPLLEQGAQTADGNGAAGCVEFR